MLLHKIFFGRVTHASGRQFDLAVELKILDGGFVQRAIRDGKVGSFEPLPARIIAEYVIQKREISSVLYDYYTT